jgi:radical SAM protein with 4Fe4S-binding SPASM domain
MRKFSVGWGLTNKCNMSCEFCYSEDTRNQLAECGIDDWKDFVDINNQSIENINYGTGENAILDDFFTFIKYVRDKYPHIGQSITTNGYVSVRTTQNPKYMQIFKECIDEVDVSVDFNDRERHSKFRGQPKAYDWARDTLKLNKELGKLSTIVFVGFNETLEKENLDGLFQLAKENDALLRMNIYRPVNPNQEINKRFLLSYPRLKEGLEYIHDKYEMLSLSDSLIGTVFGGYKFVKDNTGTSSIRILPDGTICPSTYLIRKEHRTDANIKNTNLEELHFEKFENIETPEACHECKFEDTCKGGVYDRRMLWYDTFAERDPYCPTRHGDKIPEEPFKTTKLRKVSIHDGYLPTLFFKNRTEGCVENEKQ